MDKHTDHDASVDRLLAGTLKARAGEAPGDACLDADTLAAWADGALGARERTAVETHAADCPHCQALLAAMVRTEPPSAAAKAPWRLPAIGWLVPVTVAVTALVIWVAVPRREPVQISDGGAVAVEQAPPARTPALAAAPTPAPSRIDAQASADADTRERRDAAPLEKKALPEASAPAPANALAEAATAPAAAPAAPSALKAGAPAAARESAGADANLAREAPTASARISAFANAPEVVVVSSNPSTRFRLLRGGGVQRTADAGATWRTEATPAAETLTAGSSPSPSVCWLVGPSGTVLLSADGRSWRRLAFPETADLRSVAATDGDNATVTAVDGRIFVTADGGRSWSRLVEP